MCGIGPHQLSFAALAMTTLLSNTPFLTSLAIVKLFMQLILLQYTTTRQHDTTTSPPYMTDTARNNAPFQAIARNQ